MRLLTSKTFSLRYFRRAGKSGVAISLLKSGQLAAFNRMRRQIQHPNNRVSADESILVPSMGISKSRVRRLVPIYRRCIGALRDVLEAEENGELKRNEQLSSEYFELPQE